MLNVKAVFDRLELGNSSVTAVQTIGQKVRDANDPQLEAQKIIKQVRRFSTSTRRTTTPTKLGSLRKQSATKHGSSAARFPTFRNSWHVANCVSRHSSRIHESVRVREARRQAHCSDGAEAGRRVGRCPGCRQDRWLDQEGWQGNAHAGPVQEALPRGNDVADAAGIHRSRDQRSRAEQTVCYHVHVQLQDEAR